MKKLFFILQILLFTTPLIGFAQRNQSLVYSLDSLPISSSMTIQANIASCGEFGGHRERIIVFRNVKGYSATLKRDSPCIGRTSLADVLADAKDEPKDITIQLSQNEKKLINDYFTSFSKYKKVGTGEFNAANSFNIKTHSGSDYLFIDRQFIWDDFTPLKNQLFGTNSISNIR
jgi:hypothetical protein